MAKIVGNIERSFKIAILLTFIFFAIEAIGGYVSNSLSLLSDSGHMFRDAFALILSYSAILVAKKLPTKEKTFGYHRVEVLAAIFNSILLIVISIWILLEAVDRLSSPPDINTPIMLIVASSGLLINVYIGLQLHGQSDLNVKSAYFHVLTDAISSLIIVIGAIFIHITGTVNVDAFMSIIIVVIIFASSYSILRPAVKILLEFSPDNVDYDGLIASLEQVEGVRDVHNIRIWSICSNINAFDAHFLIDDQMLSESESIKADIKKILEENSIQYSTIEFECESCDTTDKLPAIGH